MTEFENQEALTDAEKEKAYREAVGYLSSSLTNDELIEQSLSVLLSLGDYRDAASLYQTYKAKYEASQEEKYALLQKRKVSRVIQGVLVTLAFGLILALVLVLVFVLKLDIVR
ncbi:MAG: hypothetical protein IJW46_01190 [Clostridia bacterium]|nr:hypothetical protein [Clostridia bacterium]